MMSSGHHLHWDAEALWESLVPLLDGISVEVLPRCESTNTQLLERARAADGDRSPCLLVAEQQTRGRGRLGRDWVSEAGASVTFSLALPMAPTQWGGLSLAVGLAVAEALDTASPHRLALKWPNDLWLLDGPGRGRKLGGILIETLSVGPQRWVVVGVGLNVAPRQAEAVAGLAHGYACLQELQPGCTAPQALARVAVPLVRALKAFEHEGFAPLVPAYTRRDLLLGQVVRSSGGAGDSLQGTARGVDGQGALLLDSGGIHRVQSGEVSVRLAAASA
jgi:BirA family biotin operon repressor/biotin-[acetyl-CoA-carboxylase] ligase